MASSLTSTTLTINGTQPITGIETTLSNSSNSKVPTSKAVKDFMDSVVGAGSFIITGNWANPQYINFPVDYTGLIFLVILPNGNVINATVSSVSPSTWSSTVGTQTATFTCTAGGLSFTATKSASVRPMPVGGIVRYINTASTNTYIFYNASGTQVSAPTVGTNCTGWTYTKTGNSVDKFYISYPTTIIDKCWGYNGIRTRATGNSIGSGKTNSETVLAITDTSSYASNSIWKYIREMRTNKVNDCIDWYVGCPAEYGVMYGIDRGDYFWSSREYESTNYGAGYAYAWYVGYDDDGSWDTYYKTTNSGRFCPIRSF